MQWFKNMKVKAKMLAGFVLVIILLAIIVAIATVELITTSNEYIHVIEAPIDNEMLLYQVDAHVGDLRRNVIAMALFAQSYKKEQVDQYYAAALDSFESGIATIEHYESKLKKDTSITKAKLAEELKYSGNLNDMLLSYKTSVCDAVFMAAESGDTEAVFDYIASGVPIGVSLNAQIDELTRLADELSWSLVSETKDEANRAIIMLLIIAAAAAVISVLAAFYISGTVSKPLSVLSGFMNKAGSTGDLTIHADDMAVIEEYSKYRDETGLCMAGATSFIEHVTSIASMLEKIEQGDLAIEVELQSDADTMGKSLLRMVESLNYMFSEINVSTAQVSLGAQQIADGSQSLAQGSTEQAASVEQLSASISEIAQNTKSNAERSVQAAELATAIRNSAENGSRKMDEMMSAVKEINQASHSISKVIKVIDDIAFQTNILALNAAVEAARAGQHGKGFAVVAEEVRNLAAKSAEAAKDTGELIANSMEKAEMGSAIANETADSLTEIVNGIAESNQIVEEIAASSEQQSVGIAQINQGIEQVAHVVQQNSATAEESAAASQEMSGQAIMLEDLISQFRIKADETTPRRIPGGHA